MPDTSADALTARTSAITTSLRIISVAIVLAGLYFASSILITVICSLFVAFLLDPGVRLLERLRFPRWLGALIMVLVGLAVVYLLIYIIYGRLVAFYQELPKVEAAVRRVIAHLESGLKKFMQYALASQPAAPGPDVPALRLEPSAPWFQFLARGVGPVYQFAITAFFVPFLAFFMLASKDRLMASTLNLFHVRHRHRTETIISSIGRMVRQYVLGNLLVALISAAVLTPIFMLIGLRFALILGPVAAALTLIPYLGVLLSIVPPLLVALVQFDRAGPFIAIAVAVIGVHFFAMNVLTPKLVGRSVKLNALSVTLAMLFWGWLWGAVGLLLAVPITAAIKAVCDNVPTLKPLGAWMGNSAE